MKNILRSLAAASAVFAAAPAAAQVLLLDVQTTVPMAATFDNPCTANAESIVFQGGTQLYQRVWLMPDGKVRLQIAENTAMTGSDTAALLGSSTSYSVAAGSEHDLELDPVSFAVAKYKKVAGTSDNFHSVLVMAFDPQSLQLKLGLEAACDNGLP